MNLFGEAEKLLAQAEEHGLVDKAVEQAEKLAEEKTGHKYDAQVEKGGTLLEGEAKKRLAGQ